MAKTILLTGATDGIGLLTAQNLSAQGHRVLLHGRNQAKMDAAMAQMSGDVASYMADMSRLQDVSRMADGVLAQEGQIDVLINNAGVLKTSQTKTAEGLDIRFVVNTLAPYVLTKRLLPTIPKAGRVVNLSSAAQAPVDVDVMMGRKAADDLGTYAQSKLAITIWSREMAAELSNGPAIIAVNPGSLLASKMVKEGFGVAGNDLQIGANILCRAALDAEFSEASGKYFDNDSGAFAEPNPAAQDPAHVQMVMTVIEDAVRNLNQST